MILLSLALSLAAHPHPPALQGAHESNTFMGPVRAPSLSRREREKAAKPTKGEVGRIDEVARRYGLAGELLVAKGDRIVLHRGYGTIAPSGGAPHKVGERWRLASVTKQVTAALLVGKYPGALDRPVKRKHLGMRFGDEIMSGGLPDGLTLRDLLTHRSGLVDPDDTPKDAAGVPAFYALPAFIVHGMRPAKATQGSGYCLSKPGVRGSAFRYNNCDYIVAAQAMSGVGRWPRGMTMVGDSRDDLPGFVGDKPEPRFQLSSWGAAGGLVGTARAVFDFDRSLMTGKLLPTAARDELWKPEGNGSYQALGQWVFPGKLAGCTAPKRIVQRDGEIWGVQVRNFILPDDDLVVIVFTNRSADDFAIGEVWQGKGFAYDLISAAACA